MIKKIKVEKKSKKKSESNIEIRDRFVNYKKIILNKLK